MASDQPADGDLLSALRFRKRVGQIVQGKWRVDALISAGPISSIYLASVVPDGAIVALKILHPELALDETTRARFEREREVANAINHPGVVRVFENGVSEDGAPFLVMELLQGESLETLRQRSGGTLPVEQVVRLGRQLLEILAVAHARGVIHRDIKPANTFLLTSGTVKLIDFGIAWDAMRSGPVTGIGIAMGTSAFMPPEQALARRDEIDARSDLWSVGATLFTLLTGKAVHDYESPHAQLLAATTKPAPPLRDVAPLVPRAVAAVIDRALSFERDKRWDDADSMREALRWTVIQTPNIPFPRPGWAPPSSAPISVKPVAAKQEPPASDRQPVSLAPVDSLAPAQHSIRPAPRRAAAAAAGTMTGLVTFAVALTLMIAFGRSVPHRSANGGSAAASATPAEPASTAEARATLTSATTVSSSAAAPIVEAAEAGAEPSPPPPSPNAAPQGEE